MLPACSAIRSALVAAAMVNAAARRTGRLGSPVQFWRTDPAVRDAAKLRSAPRRLTAWCDRPESRSGPRLKLGYAWRRPSPLRTRVVSTVFSSSVLLRVLSPSRNQSIVSESVPGRGLGPEKGFPFDLRSTEDDVCGACAHSLLAHSRRGYSGAGAACTNASGSVVSYDESCLRRQLLPFREGLLLLSSCRQATNSPGCTVEFRRRLPARLRTVRGVAYPARGCRVRYRMPGGARHPLHAFDRPFPHRPLLRSCRRCALPAASSCSALAGSRIS